MRILFLCNKSPYPPKEGGPLAMNANIEGLVKRGHQVKVIALNTNKYSTNLNEIPEEYKKKTGIEFVYIDLSIKPLHAFLNLFSNKSYHVERFISRDLKSKLIEILNKDEYDIVQLELLYMTPYIDLIRKHSDAKIILRSHNVEHLIWERITSIASNSIKKLYLKGLTRKLKNFELATLNSYDGIASISSKDAEYFKKCNCTIPIVEIPFGVDIAKYQLGESEIEFPSLFHLGAMNWVPNEEGIKWFLDMAWPLIHNKYPYLKFYIAGRMMPTWLMNINLPNVQVLGEVPDATQFMQSKALMMVPLFSGSGIRIKIIEGMALGKAIVSTSIGAEGIEYANEENILIANTPEQFLKAIDKCIENIEFVKQLGLNARKLIEEKHNIDLITKNLEEFYQMMLEK